MLSQEVRDALQAELEHLRIRRAKIVAGIDKRILAIEAVLAPEPEGLATASQQLPLKAVAPAVPEGAETGFRDKIRAVLAEHPNSGAPEVTRYLEQQGVQATGATRLGVRVANELFRMAQRGHLRKRKARYSLPETVEEMIASA